MTESGSIQKILIMGLLFFFSAIVLATIARRIAAPSLIVVRAQPMAAPESEMGRLMKEAAVKPGDAQVLVKLAAELLGRGEMDAANDFARRALEADPKNASALHLAGVIRHREGKHAEAAAFMEKSLASMENAPTRYSLGVLYSHFLNDRQKGIENFKKGLQDAKLTPALRQELEKELARLEQEAPPTP